MPSLLKLNESSVLFQCLQNCQETVALTDGAGKICFVNRAWCQTYGYAKDEVLGQTHRIIRSHRHGQEFYERMWREIVDERRGGWKGELVNRKKNGQEIPVYLSISPVRDASHAIIGYLGIGIDESQKKKDAVDALRKDRVNSMAVLASGLAHEIGNPLATVRGRAELALTKLDPSSPAASDLRVIVSQADRISELLGALVQLMVDNPGHPSETAVITEVFESVLKLIREKLAAHKIEFKNLLAPDTRVAAPTDRLAPIILNLFTNALHAIESSIQNGRTEDHHITVTRKDRGEQWEVTVIDSGCGMVEKDLANLFRPFFTTKDVGEGKGLGLSIAHQLVTSWGGSLQIESRAGEGTSVILRLPKAK